MLLFPLRADGRTLTRLEIAALLGLTPQTVREAIKRGVRRLRAAPEEPARRREPRNKEAERQARRAAQQASLDQAYARLASQGVPITMLSLAREAQVSTTTANAYLCRRWGTVPPASATGLCRARPSGRGHHRRAAGQGGQGR